MVRKGLYKRTKWGKNIAVALVSFVLSLFSAEILFRWYENTYLLEKLKIGPDVIDLAALRLNDTSVLRKTPADTFRILSFGDSFAWGPVKYHYTYHAVAARRLTESRRSQRYRIVNLGEPSTSLYQYMSGYDYWSKRIEHDGVVFTVYLGNDLLDVAQNDVPKKQGPTESVAGLDEAIQLKQVRSSIPSRFQLRLLDHLYAQYLVHTGELAEHSDGDDSPYHPFSSHLSERRYYENIYDQLANFDENQLPRLRSAYEAIAELIRFVSDIRKSGKSALIMLAPHEVQVDGALRQEMERRYNISLDNYDFALSNCLIKEFVRRIDREIPLLDLLPALRLNSDKGGKLYFGRNTHWSKDGNELVGRLLAQSITREWFSSPGRLVNKGSCVNSMEDYLESILGHMSSLDAANEISKLRGRTAAPTFALDLLNGQQVGTPESDVVQTFKNNHDGFSLAGWAVDRFAKRCADGVYIEIGEKLYKATYGLRRVDLAKQFLNSEYQNCGFSLNIPARELSTSDVTLRIRVVSHDGLSIFDSRPLRFVLE